MNDINEIRHRILSNPFLNNFYDGIFREVKALLSDGSRNYELGSGSGIGHLYLPSLTCTELETNEFVHIQVDASDLPWQNSAVDNFVLVNTFHHLPFVTRFLSDASRCLRVGGRVVLIEPFWSPLGILIYSLLHPEPFNPLVSSWDNGKLSPWESNQALSWVVFRRDSKGFKEKFPELKVGGITPFSGLSYVLSGGVHHTTRIPPKRLISLAEWEKKQGNWLWPFRMFCIIWLEKTREISP